MTEDSRQKFCGEPGVFYQGITVKEDGRGKFFAYEDGTLVLPEHFDEAEYFQNDLAWVKRNGKWIRINKLGEKVSL